MDIFSHALWTGLVYRKEKKIWWPIFFSVAPDIFSNGIYVISALISGVPFLDISREHLSPAHPAYVKVLYSSTHSLIIFVAVFLLVWLLLKKPWWPLAAWGLHIAIDIPTHTAEYSATPFLFPVSNFKISSISYVNSYFLIANFSILAILYFGLFVIKNKQKSLRAYLHEERKIKKM